MKIEVQSTIGFVDSEIIKYTKEGGALSVVLKAWNENLIIVQFDEAIAIYDIGAWSIEGFFQESTGSQFFLKALNAYFESVPDSHEFKCFQFMGLDGEVSFEVVSSSCQIIYPVLDIS